MKAKLYIIVCLFFYIAFSLKAQTNPNHVYVNGYIRNGTYIEPHYRTAPNSTNRDNFSTLGNTNPYTGKDGWIPPDNNTNSIFNSSSTNSMLNNNNLYNNSPTYNNNSNSYKNISKTDSDIGEGEIRKRVVAYVTINDLKVRSGPSTTYSILDKLSLLDNIEITEVFPENSTFKWVKVKYHENNTFKEGYVHSYYLSGIKLEYFRESKYNVSTEFVVNREKAFFYDSPDYTSRRKGYLVYGDKGTIIFTNEDFIYTEYTSKNGNITKGWLNRNDIYK